jgi:hypothetical protein
MPACRAAGNCRIRALIVGARITADIFNATQKIVNLHVLA